MTKKPTRKSIFKLVGEGQINADGVARQKILETADPGSIVVLVREKDNSFDSNAVSVTINGRTIGYLARDDASALAPALDDERVHSAILHRLSGGVEDFPNYGAEISIGWDGTSPLPCKPLDSEQQRFRAVNLPARQRAGMQKRTEAGKFQATTSTQKGCLGAVVIAICSPLLVTGAVQAVAFLMS